MNSKEAITLGELSEKWLAATSIYVAPSTFHRRSEFYRTHIFPFFGADCPVKDITRESVEMLLGSKVTKLSNPTVNYILTVLRQALAWGEECGYISSNPCVRIKNLPVHHKEGKVFTPDEVAAMIDVACATWISDMILLAYRTGMRKGEIYGLQWQDINFEEGSLFVRRIVAGHASGLRFIRPPKSRASVRKILLDNSTLDMLKIRKGNSISDWVFPASDGGAKYPFHLTKAMMDTTKRAGIPHRGFHAFRHTHATELLSSGMPIKAVQERLGHADASMTMTTYVHALPTAQADIVKHLNQSS